jgi:hypothetical protein
MPTFTELLAPTKTHAHRALKYTPACVGVGVLELTDTRTHVRYALARQPFGGVRLTKADGRENYVVTPTSCECKGFVFSKTRQPCKHMEAVATLSAAGWLDHDGRETVGDPAELADEYDRWADAWENDRGPDRLGDDGYAAALGGAVFAVEMGGCS